MSGVDVGTAYLTVVPSARGFAGKLQADIGGSMASAGKDAGAKAAKGFGSSFGPGLKKLLIGGGVVTGVSILGKELVGAGEAASTSNARIEQVATSMGLFGDQAGVVSKRVADLAEKTALSTGVDQNQIKLTQAKLLTFKDLAKTAGNVGGAFDRATAAAVDMAAAGFGTAEQNSVQLGKALQDPVKGITALARSGVTFTDAEKARIKTLVESNKVGEAQDLVLKAIEKQVGGTAKATANASDQMKVGWSQVKESIGGAVLPLFNSLVGLLVDKVLPAIKRVTPYVSDFIAGLSLKDAGDVGAPLEGFVKIGHNVREVFESLMKSAKKLWPSVKEIGKQLFAASASAGLSTWGLFKSLLEALPGIIDGITPVLKDVAKWMGENKSIVSTLVVALTSGMAAFRVLSVVVKAFTIVQGLLNVVMMANPITLVVVALGALIGAFIYAYNTSDTFRTYVNEAFQRVKQGALTLALVAVTAFQGLANVWLTVVGALIDGAANAFGWVPGLGPKLKGAQTKFHEFKDGANAALDKIKNDIKVQINTAEASAELEALHREFISKGWTVTAEANVRMVYAGNGQLVPQKRAVGGPVYPGGIYAVGDNPDGSWNRTTELFVPDRAGTIFNQEQLSKALGGGGRSLTQYDIDRLVVAFSSIQVRGTISPASIGYAMGAVL